MSYLIKENKSTMSHNLKCNVNARCKSHSQAVLKKNWPLGRKQNYFLFWPKTSQVLIFATFSCFIDLGFSEIATFRFI